MLTDYLDFNHYTLTISFTDTVRLLSQSLSFRSFFREGVLHEDVVRDGEPGGPGVLGTEAGFEHNTQISAGIF